MYGHRAGCPEQQRGCDLGTVGVDGPREGQHQGREGEHQSGPGNRRRSGVEYGYECRCEQGGDDRGSDESHDVDREGARGTEQRGRRSHDVVRRWVLGSAAGDEHPLRRVCEVRNARREFRVPSENLRLPSMESPGTACRPSGTRKPRTPVSGLLRSPFSCPSAIPQARTACSFSSGPPKSGVSTAHEAHKPNSTTKVSHQRAREVVGSVPK